MAQKHLVKKRFLITINRKRTVTNNAGKMAMRERIPFNIAKIILNKRRPIETPIMDAKKIPFP